jgi:hypothetical protein
MKKIIKLKESDLKKIIKNIILDESITNLPNQQNNILDCVPYIFRFAVNELKKNGYNILLLKTALGVIGRESDFGSSDRYKYLNPLKTLWSFLGGKASVGYGQVKLDTAKKYNLNVNDLNTALGSLKAVYLILSKNYEKAKSVGYTDNPSSNFVEGTGSAALDISIVGFNSGEGIIVKYCETNDPNIKRNCLLSGKLVEQKPDHLMPYQPDNPGMKDYYDAYFEGKKKYKVTNKQIFDYLPNFKTKRWDGVNITSHGYVKEVAKNIKKYNCF